MGARLLVVILDGLSYSFAEYLFMLIGEPGLWLASLKRRLLYITQPPDTFTVHNTFFTGVDYTQHGVCGHDAAWRGVRARRKYLWEREPHGALVVSVPVTLPPVWHPASLTPSNALDLAFPPKEKLHVAFAALAARAKMLLRGSWRYAIVWLNLPDQYLHYRVPMIDGQTALEDVLRVYRLALKTARELYETANPDRFVLLSDHGHAVGYEEGHCNYYHGRDAIVASNVSGLPKTDLEVYEFLRSLL